MKNRVILTLLAAGLGVWTAAPMKAQPSPASFTPWTSDVDAAGYHLNNLPWLALAADSSLFFGFGGASPSEALLLAMNGHPLLFGVENTCNGLIWATAARKGDEAWGWNPAETYYGPGFTIATNANGEMRLKLVAGAAQTNNLMEIYNKAGNLTAGVSNNGVMFSAAGWSETLSNKLAPAAITFPATTVNWTNTQGFAIELYVNNSGVTGTSFKKNGTQIFTLLTGAITIGLQNGEYFSETYTAGSPTATWSPR